MDFELIKRLAQPADTKIVMLVMDGLGGLPGEAGRGTALEAAATPHLDALAAEGVCGLHQPVAAGITPGSGPAHLALFGYDPLHYEVGRGVLAALGIGFDLQPGDVAARGNFCTLDDQGRVSDRRAGRIATELCRDLCGKLRDISLEGVRIFVEPVKEYRFLLVLRGENLRGDIADTDPQKVGAEPLPPEARSAEAQTTADTVARFLEAARERLADDHPANMVLLRGFSQRPQWPTMPEIFGLRPAAVAGYPMYRGVSRLLGMEVLETGAAVDEELATLLKNWHDYDFFYCHVKKTDSAGEDGDFDRKAALIEEVDRRLPHLLELKPDVLIVTGDHSTPAAMKSHSWHPVPVLLHSPTCRPDGVERFGERACMAGGLGPRFPATDLMALAMAHAGRLAKFGA
jgi:2,3-bisphosphoglycerate-independent phosphoglycerate mutase